MSIENIRKIAIVGAGFMGNQIAEVLARVGGYQVTIVDIHDTLVNIGIKTIENRLENLFVARGKMTADEKKKIMSKINRGDSIENAVRDVDLVIEAVFENMNIKKDVFKKADLNAPSHTILASNTSYLNISEIGSLTKRPDKIIGMHFFNPPGKMKLVEIPKSPLSSTDTVETIKALARKLDKEPVVCIDASYGFLANRAVVPMRLEATQMLWERVASPEDIDKAVKLGYNYPMGPLELGDMTGAWGIWAAGEEEKIKELGSEKGRLHPLIRMMVRAGYTGGAGKKGIYDFWKEVLSKQ